MKRKVMGWLTLVGLLLALLPTGALAASSGAAGENVTWSYDDSTKTLTFSGTGAIPDYTIAEALGAAWSSLSPAPAALVIEEGITRVGDCAFTSNGYSSITIADSVKSIGDKAFNASVYLETVTIGNPNVIIEGSAFNQHSLLASMKSFKVGGKDYGTPEAYIEASKVLVDYVAPEGTTAIDDYAFQGRETLETVVLPEGVTTIGASAFAGCTNLKSITLPSTLTTIGGNAFDGCASLESIKLPESLKILGESAFQKCTALTSVAIPKNITTFGMGAFAECANLAQVNLTQGLTIIGDSAFYNCPKLTSITIPDSVHSIGRFAFRATSLTGVTIPRSVTYLGDYPFGVAGLGSDMTWVTDFTITGYAGTAAETYAKDVGFPFHDLTPPPSTPSSSDSSGSYSHTHSWDNGVVTLEPTDLTSGLRTYTCKGCGATRTESISAGWAAPVKGGTVVITGTPNSKDPSTGLRVISSTGTDPDAQGGQAYASTQSVEVDGKPVEFEMYALKDAKGNYTNYVKLRDVALTVNGTDAQCDVDWADGYVTVTTHTAYQPNGSEMKTPFTGDRAYTAANGITMIDGEGVVMQAFVLMDDKGGGYTYYKLRDLGQALGFNVGWSGEKGVYIETDRPYDPGN